MSTVLETLEFATGPQPQATVIILHGLGADGNDFVPVAQMLDTGVETRFIFPHAPPIPVTINNGYVMRAWYDILVSDLVRQEDEAGLRQSQTALDALIAREIERGIPSERIVLMGFSQGCAMTLLTGLRQAHRLAGLVGLSGYLPLLATTAQERSPANLRTPIFLAHGDQDPIVPLARAIATRDHLRSLGHPVDWHTYPIPHTVSPEEIADIQTFLKSVLKQIPN
ncbi:MAG: dienelactone hydrolase family protein [Lautropia sp.]|nr:dienelactone hydrolase family protein [Lautropia sp.]